MLEIIFVFYQLQTAVKNVLPASRDGDSGLVNVTAMVFRPLSLEILLQFCLGQNLRLPDYCASHKKGTKSQRKIDQIYL